MKDRSPTLYNNSNNNSSWWIQHPTLYFENCKFVICSQDECRDACNLLFSYFKKLDRSLQKNYFCIYNHNTFELSIFPKLLHAYQNSKFLAIISKTYFKLMHSMPMIVFCGVLLQMHNTYGMK
jgi:hypothetical protein